MFIMIIKKFVLVILIFLINKQATAITGEEISAKVSQWLLKEGIKGTPVFSKNTFYVHLIPETLKTTNLDELIYDNYVNLEFDQATIAIVDTTERLINQKR